jgi:hypothetical protein
MESGYSLLVFSLHRYTDIESQTPQTKEIKIQSNPHYFVIKCYRITVDHSILELLNISNIFCVFSDPFETMDSLKNKSDALFEHPISYLDHNIT